MLIVEPIRKIRQACHRDKKPIRQIAREIHLSKNTVKKIIEATSRDEAEELLHDVDAAANGDDFSANSPEMKKMFNTLQLCMAKLQPDE